jgi:hypothetical protein
MDFSTWTEEEIKHWCWLRAIEWDAFPAYLSQLLAPPLFIFFPWYLVILAVFIFGALWCIVRIGFVSVALANFACIVVMWGKWPVALGSAIFLFFNHQLVAGVVSILWPLIAGFVGLFPGKVGVHEIAFAKKLGFVPSKEA